MKHDVHDNVSSFFGVDVLKYAPTELIDLLCPRRLGVSTWLPRMKRKIGLITAHLVMVVVVMVT